MTFPIRPRITQRLLADLRALIESTRGRVAQAVNASLVLLYWQVGRRIRQDILRSQRGEYGKQILSTLSKILSSEYGKGFDRSNLFHMVRFAEVFPDREIVDSLGRPLGWTHFRHFIYVGDPLKRDFYAEMCRM